MSDIVERLRLRGLHFAADKIEQLEADLAAERALADQLHHAMCVSAVRLSYPEVFDALAAYREARRER